MLSVNPRHRAVGYRNLCGRESSITSDKELDHWTLKVQHSSKDLSYVSEHTHLPVYYRASLDAESPHPEVAALAIMSVTARNAGPDEWKHHPQSWGKDVLP